VPIDYRRFSTAGNLDIYRPERYHNEVLVERVEPLKISVDRSPAVEPLWIYNWSKPTERVDKFRDPLDEYELRREAELKVKGRSNGPIPMTYYSAPLTYSMRTRPVSPAPSVDVSRPKSARSTAGRQPITNAGLALTESQNDLDEFERMMKRKFGYGGVNRYSTPLYTAPPYYSPYMYSPTYSSGTLPASQYSPYYYYSPYYRGSVGSTLDTLPAYYTRGTLGSTLDTLPAYYTSNTYSGPYTTTRPYDYNLYSPPSRITAPGGYYVSYYDPIISGYDRYPVRYTTSYSR